MSLIMDVLNRTKTSSNQTISPGVRPPVQNIPETETRTVTPEQSRPEIFPGESGGEIAAYANVFVVGAEAPAGSGPSFFRLMFYIFPAVFLIGALSYGWMRTRPEVPETSPKAAASLAAFSSAIFASAEKKPARSMLEGTFVGSGGAYCILEGDIYRVGDVWKKAKLVSIEAGRVKLQKPNGSEVELRTDP
ncbi:MAG: hypothetical protein ACOY3K_06165 [Candidatus Omnitrophota bacterium]